MSIREDIDNFYNEESEDIRHSSCDDISPLDWDDM